jgi:hypothetical protein
MAPATHLIHLRSNRFTIERKPHSLWQGLASRWERIEQAKEDWKTGKFAPVPGETEFVPLPDS